jgi:hypothetical protein
MISYRARSNPGARQRLDELLDEGEMDGDDVQMFAQALEMNERSLYLDADLEADDLLYVGKNSDLSDTEMILRDADGNTLWLEVNEGANVGWDKIVRKHDDDFYKQYKSVDTREDIKLVIRRVLDKADSDPGEVVQKPNPGGGTRYYYQLEENAHPV